MLDDSRFDLKSPRVTVLSPLWSLVSKCPSLSQLNVSGGSPVSAKGKRIKKEEEGKNSRKESQ